MKRIGLLLAVVVLMAGCASMNPPLPEPVSVFQRINTEGKSKDITSVITFILVGKGFDITMVNEQFGLVTTNFIPIKTSDEDSTNAGLFFASALAGRGSLYSAKYQIQLTFMLSPDGYQVNPKIKYTASQSNAFSTSTANESVIYPAEDSKEGFFVNGVIGDINKILKIDNSPAWSNKAI